MCRRVTWVSRWMLVLLWASGCIVAGQRQLQSARPAATADSLEQAVIDRFIKRNCVDCHNSEDRTGGLALDAIGSKDLSQHSLAWEKVVRMLRARRMPPAEVPRPEERSYQAVLSALESALDNAAAKHPNPGRTDTFRRLNRTEYQNAIRDLLALDVDATVLLPADDASHGFDNVTVGDLSPTLLNRYITAAQKISRLAIGRSHNSPGGDTIRIRPDLTQEERVEGLPIGTRGGAVIPYNFPQNGEYEIQIRLARDRNEHVEGMNEPHEIGIAVGSQAQRSGSR